MNNKRLNGFRTFQIVIFVIFILPILAPILARLGLTFPAQLIYFLYSFSCHQLDWRSIHLFDYQIAWCARDTLIWGGILASTFIIERSKFRVKYYHVLPFIVPIALDGGIQTIATMLGLTQGAEFYTSTNFMRALTGGFFGLGMGMFLSTLVYEMNGTEELKDNFLSSMKISLLGTGILIVFYLLLVTLWSVTSLTYKPANILDFEVKTPVSLSDRWTRQSHGLCKGSAPKDITNGNSINNLIFSPADCFNAK